MITLFVLQIGWEKNCPSAQTKNLKISTGTEKANQTHTWEKNWPWNFIRSLQTGTRVEWENSEAAPISSQNLKCYFTIPIQIKQSLCEIYNYSDRSLKDKSQWYFAGNLWRTSAQNILPNYLKLTPSMSLIFIFSGHKMSASCTLSSSAVLTKTPCSCSQREKQN